MQAVQPAPNVWAEKKSASAAYKVIKETSVTIADKKKLAADQQTACIQALKALSIYLEDLDRVTSHPLLLNSDFWDNAETLKSAHSELEVQWGQRTPFRACCSVADFKKVKNSDQNPGPEALETFFQNSLPPEDPTLLSRAQNGTILWDNKASTLMVLETLRNYAAKYNPDTYQGLNPAEIEKCRKIFAQVREYLEVLRPVLDCKQFRKPDFFNSVWSTMHLVTGQDATFDPKIDKLYNAIVIEDRRSSRASSASSSAASSAAPSALSSPTGHSQATPKGSPAGAPNSPMQQAKTLALGAASRANLDDRLKEAMGSPSRSEGPQSPLPSPQLQPTATTAAPQPQQQAYAPPTVTTPLLEQNGKQKDRSCDCTLL
jgi:hypothetical protein